MTKLAIVCGAGLVSGKEIMALELGNGMRAAGLDVRFVTSRWGSRELGRGTEAAGFKTLRLWLGFISASPRPRNVWMTLDQMVHWPALLAGYRHFLRDFDPAKVVHTNWHHLLLLWPVLRRDRDIFWIHEVLPNENQYRQFFQPLAKRLGGFVAVSEAVRAGLIRLGVPASQVRIIHNGMSDPAAEKSPGGSSALKIGIAGQVGPWKGHEDLLQAFQVVAHKFPTAELHIFGTGTFEYEQKLRSIVERSSLEQKVFWRGFVADRAEIYGNLAVMAVPSRSEDPLPTTAIEAAYFRIPVVGTRLGGLPEIIEDGTTGFLVEAGNTSGFADALIRLLGDAQLRQRMGDEARQRALNLFSRERFVRQFANLLDLADPEANT